MANTYVQIGSTVTVGSGGAASIDFSSIPATYTDLCLKISARSSRSAKTDTMFLKFNGTSTTYPTQRLYTFGTTIGADTPSSTGFIIGGVTGATATASTFTNTEIYAPDYVGSAHKSIYVNAASEDNTATGNFLMLEAGVWQNTAAINQITLTCDVGTFVQHSSASLYGIKKS
jgi:hypothetical protein